MLEDIRALADHFRGGKRFVLVAHDWGGALAWSFATAHPEYLQAWSQPGALTGGLNYYRASHLGPPAPAQVAEQLGPSNSQFGRDTEQTLVRVPTLVVWGEKDAALLPRNLDGLEQYVPQLTIKRVPDGSHWVIHEKPGEVNGYIREFIG